MDDLTAAYFLNVSEIVAPKDIGSLTALWEDIFFKQAEVWKNIGGQVKHLKETYHRLVSLATAAPVTDAVKFETLVADVGETDNQVLYGIVRALHVRLHMAELDKMVAETLRPKKQIKKGDDMGLLDSKLILQSFLDYLNANGPDRFPEFLGQTVLRLVSTVHPNETERNTSLMHYATIFEKYSEWRRNFESMEAVSPTAPEYRLRRELLNQLRRAIKAELETLWQSDQMRDDPIPVTSEATRILERYKVIFRAYPMFLKFVKQLAKEAYWLYQGSINASHPTWALAFKANASTGNSRKDKLRAIKKTFAQLGAEKKPPRVVFPVIIFGTWKGGDRDGNPFVVASFTNQTLVDQKEFVLQRYIELASELLDKLTPSEHHVEATPELKASYEKDSKAFPYLPNIKPWEPFRAKIRFVLEKLNNTLLRTQETKKSAGETVKPLLGMSMPGPAGYHNVSELESDLQVVYAALLYNGKSQARSILQDFLILVQTFGLHLTSIDFRQTSDKNAEAVTEYLTAVGHEAAGTFGKMNELEKQKLLVQLITTEELAYSQWQSNTMTKTTRDTFDTLLIFADAARSDPNSVGKFIISMCQSPSDILNMLLMLKLAGMLEGRGGRITRCNFDITGLFETVKDLVNAPSIISDLLAIPVVRNYVCEHRAGKLAVMVGYSDSVRDGSALASDAQIIATTVALKELEAQLNEGKSPTQRVTFVFYRGRGDTLPRGFGGSITKAIKSQLLCSAQEDHTEQNRYLRHYFTVSSALDHLHRVYSAHLSLRLSTPPAHTTRRQVVSFMTHTYLRESYQRFQKFFDFYGKISTAQWRTLVQGEKDCMGKVYFDLLARYSILPHLPRSHFASRPVARDGISYNIDKIRAIPFAMVLAQMREFTGGYYGAGTAFERGAQFLADAPASALYLLAAAMQFESETELKDKLAANYNSNLLLLLKQVIPNISAEVFAKAKALQPSLVLAVVLPLYASPRQAVETIASLVLDLTLRKQQPLAVLQEMYHVYPPFKNSIENKESSLIIRNKRIVDDYCRGETKEERAVLDESEREAQLTREWLLGITGQKELESKTYTINFNSPEALLLHLIQSKFLRAHRELTAKKSGVKGEERSALMQRLNRMDKMVQMTILAVSQGLGFAG